MKTRFFALPAVLPGIAAVPGCKHPLAIVGRGDIVDANDTDSGCTLARFRALDIACIENEVIGDYFINCTGETQTRLALRPVGRLLPARF